MGPFGPALVLACRIVLACVLVVAAIGKIADRHALSGRLRDMGVPARWSRPVAIALPVAEIAIAAGLVALPGSAVPAYAALVLLAAFTAFLIPAAHRRVPCACFGSVRTTASGTGPAAILRNGVLIALGVVATGSVSGAKAAGTIVALAIVGAIAATVVARVP